MTHRTHVTVLLSSSRVSGIDIALSLAEAHPQLLVVLCDAATPLARHDHPNAALIQNLLHQQVTVYAEAAACARRGIDHKRLADGVTMVDTNTIADELVDATTKVVWL
ncbi:DsrE family protein [Stomatohabitans albus]|uniref:DsrE family protein n=1 Tax=Stomatohabitans albus TaxID=3110766 RepID=UPI00300C2EBE